MNVISVGIKVADEAWIATALLHRESPDSEDFTIQEILERARRENVFGSLRPGVYIHANTHGVANRPPSPAGLRMLYETGPGRRRLFRKGDHAHPKRLGKTMPQRDQIPEQYRHLLDWYEAEYAPVAQETWLSGIFAMAGAGKETFADEHADEYVRRLREGWE